MAASVALSDEEMLRIVLEKLGGQLPVQPGKTDDGQSKLTIGLTTFSKPLSPLPIGESERKLLRDRIAQRDKSRPIEDFIRELQAAAAKTE